MKVINPTAISSPSLPCPPDQADDFLGRPSPEVVAALGALPGPILVLGAGGKMGLHLSLMAQRAVQLAGSTSEVIAVSRFGTLRDRGDFSKFGIRTIACDLEHPVELAALPDAPTVCFMAGVKFGTATDPRLLQRLNVDMPRLVAERYKSSRIVAFSTGCIYPFVTPESGGATENISPGPVGQYAESCLAREQVFQAASQRYGTQVTLLRLNYSVEFRYGVLVDVAQKVMRGEPVDVSTGYTNVIWQTDAVAHALLSFAVAGTPAAPLNVTGPEILSVRALAIRFGEILGREPMIVGTESATAWLSNAAHSHQLLGKPHVSTEQMMHWVAAWLGQGQGTWGKPTGFERRDGQF